MPGRTILVTLAACVAVLAFAGTALALDIADASPPSGVVGMPYSYTFSLSPGSGSPGASWSVSSGALPPGLRLSSNDRTATVLGTPAQAGSFRFYLQVRDKPGPWVCCTEEEFTITVDPALDITASPDLPTGSVGSVYGYQLATAGGTAQTWALSSGALPAGMTLTAEGAVTGTPTQAALAQFTVTAADGSRKVAKQFTLKVLEPIVVTAPVATTMKAGAPFRLSFSAKGGLAPYTWSAVSLPGGVSLNPATGLVGGSPGSGRTDASYEGVSLTTLHTWLRYWEGVKAGTIKIAAGSKDTIEMAPTEVSKLRKAIEARSKPSDKPAVKMPTGRFVVSLKVTDALGTSSTGTTTVNVVSKLAIVTRKLPLAHTGKRFVATLRTSGGAGRALRLAGTRPAWLSFDAKTGRLTGTPKLAARKPLVMTRHTKHGLRRVVKHRPTRPVTYSLHLTAVDALGQRATQKLKLTVRP